MPKFVKSFQHWDESWCLRCNRACRIRVVRSAMLGVSRLGDGVFWYVLMLALLAAGGKAAAKPVAYMILAGGTGTLVYKLLKVRTLRPRPYQVNQAISLGVAPLDQFSFPSGHTLHAVAFTMVALAYYPMLAWLLVPFTVLVAISRMVLGLHYPSDVLAGGLVGGLISSIVLKIAA
jgi:undecaprenyl-diphosphatase